MIRRVAARRLPLVAAGLLGAQASCALLYDFAGEGGAGATAGSGATASAGEATTVSQSSTDAVAASDSASSGAAPWKCATMADCFGAACNSDGTCADAVITLAGTARGLQIHEVGDVPTVAVVTSVVSPPTGIIVSIVSGVDQVEETPPVTTDPNAYTGFVAHDEDEVVMTLPATGTVHRHVNGAWEVPGVSFSSPVPGGAGGSLNGILSGDHGWLGVAKDKLITFTPDPEGWSFNDISVDTAMHAGWLGHSVIHFAGNKYALSMFTPVNDQDPGCLATAEYVSDTWNVGCSVSGLARLSALASDGKLVAFRSQISDMQTTVDVVSMWEPATGATREISRSPSASAQSVAIDGNHVYFDANTLMDGLALFRCSKTASALTPPDEACDKLVPGAITGLGSLRLGEPPEERFLVCWADDAVLTCRVTR
jgi:hypothetical protein